MSSNAAAVLLLQKHYKETGEEPFPQEISDEEYPEFEKGLLTFLIIILIFLGAVFWIVFKLNN